MTAQTFSAPLETLRKRVQEATQRLLGDTIGISDDDWNGPSGLPGWSRAHVAAHLAANADRVVSRDELFATVWSDRGLDADSRTVDAHIKRLRAKLDAPDLVSTVRGEGYRFNSAPSVLVRSTQLARRRTALAA
mgnify:CR=1 FL=1